MCDTAAVPGQSASFASFGGAPSGTGTATPAAAAAAAGGVAAVRRRPRAQSCLRSPPSPPPYQPANASAGRNAPPASSAVDAFDKQRRSRLNTLQTSSFHLPLFANRQRSSTWHGNALLAPDATDDLSLNSYVSCDFGEDASSNRGGDADSVELQEKQLIQEIVCDVLYTELLNTEHDEAKSSRRCAFIAECVLTRVKEALGSSDDIRLIATAYIGKQNDADPIFASCQCLWEVETDRLVNVNFQNGSLFAICSVFIVNTCRD